jgi:dUTP pyrophosphatase
MVQTIKVKKVHSKAILPKVATQGSACFDLYCCEDFVMSNGYFVKAKTGLIFEIPKGYHVKIYPRSGMAAKGIVIPNSPGVIDSDYRGEIIVMLYGLCMKGHEIFQVGHRIAQGELVKGEPVEFQVFSQLSSTDRGTGGFGSTGK